MVSAGGPLRIVFFGTPAFAVPTLKRLLDSAHHVVAVVTQPDRPRGRGQRISDAPVKALDAGPMLARAVRPIGLEEGSDVVERALATMGADLLVSLLEDLVAGRIPEVPQDEAAAT